MFTLSVVHEIPFIDLILLRLDKLVFNHIGINMYTIYYSLIPEVIHV